jgi:hypothetical protein
MKQIILLLAVYALIINQRSKHLSGKHPAPLPAPKAVVKPATPKHVYPPQLNIAASITTKLPALSAPARSPKNK